MTLTQRRAYAQWEQKSGLWARHHKDWHPPAIPKCLRPYFRAHPCADHRDEARRVNAALNQWMQRFFQS